MSDSYAISRAGSKVKKCRKRPSGQEDYLPWWSALMWLGIFVLAYIDHIHKHLLIGTSADILGTLWYFYVVKRAIEWGLWRRQEGLKKRLIDYIHTPTPLSFIHPVSSYAFNTIIIVWPFYDLPLLLLEVRKVLA
jgi:hypothetical protein